MEDVSAIMNFTYYPYGNARERQNPDGSWTFSCQHGVNECTVNTMFACAMYYHPKYIDYVPFVDCVEGASSPVNAGAKCAATAQFDDWDSIKSCYTGSLGNKLQHKVAVATESLNPPHQYTPWVVINGEPYKGSSSLTDAVCAAYTGSNKPAACNRTPVSKKLCMKNQVQE